MSVRSLRSGFNSNQTLKLARFKQRLSSPGAKRGQREATERHLAAHLPGDQMLSIVPQAGVEIGPADALMAPAFFGLI